MTKRERRIMFIAGGVAAVVVGWQVIKGQIIDRLEQQRVAVKRYARDKATLDRYLTRDINLVEHEWKQLTRRTLGTDINDVQLRFRSDVTQLLERHGLVIDDVTVVKDLSPREKHRNFEDGFVEVPVSVVTEGTLGQIIAFLHDLYGRPYLVQVSRLRLDAEEPESERNRGGRGRGRQRGGATADEPKITLSVTAWTLILPRTKTYDDRMVPHPVARDLDRGDAGLLTRSEPGAYDTIVDTNVFKIYRPRVVRRSTPQPRDEPDPTPEPRREPPPRDLRVYAQDWKLVGVTRMGENYVAYVLDESNVTQPTMQYTVNELIEKEGWLAVVHPEGVVVLGGDEKGHNLDERRPYFYPLGAHFSERVPLEEAPPSVVELYSRVYES